MKDTEKKLQEVLNLAAEYIGEAKNKEWVEGEDWVSYSGPYFNEKEYLAALEVLLSGWLVFGENAREFEIKFPEYLGKKLGTLTNSGSSALLLAMSALKSKNLYNLPAGTKFITPVVCWPTTLSSMLQNGFEPVFVDVTLPDLNLDLDQMEQRLKDDPSIRGVIFAHVLGNPPNMDRLMSMVEEYDLIFVEDACDALGSFYDGKKLGSFGHMSTCSFFPAHHMTMGEGGFVATNSAKTRKIVTSMRDWGRACYCNTGKPGCVLDSTACGNRFRNWLPGMPETIYDHRYVFDEIGYNLKPLDLQAAMGLKQLEKVPEMDAARRANFEKLNKVFQPYEKYLHLPKATEKSDPCWFAYLLTVREGAPFSRNDIVSHLEKSKIQTRSYFAGNILMHPGYHHMAEKYGDMNKTFPIANMATTNSFFVGTYAGITEEKMNYVKKVVDNFFKEIVGEN